MTDLSIERDVCFAQVAGQRLCLDIYRPGSGTLAPTVLYVHGGGWARGSKRDHSAERLEAMARLGLSVVSVDYRLAPDHTYPAQIHDIKAAVRWLRANGVERGMPVERLAVWGASAGGYLATMVGLTANDAFLEGEVGSNRDRSSAVQAVVSWFAPHDLPSVSRRSSLERRLCGIPSAQALLGRDEISHHDDFVRNASPSRRIHPGAPPFIIAHGDCDHIVWASESINLHANLSREGVDATLCVLAGAGHEDTKFDSPANLALTAAWLREKLQ